jgi:hypothetical protein
MDQLIGVEHPIHVVENHPGWFRVERVLPEGAPSEPYVQEGTSNHFGRVTYWIDPRRLDPRTCVEGTLDEWRQVAAAVLEGGTVEFRRCAAEVRGDCVLFWSPRNSNDVFAAVPLAVARKAMAEFLAAYPRESAP